jgi:raffinose synthase
MNPHKLFICMVIVATGLSCYAQKPAEISFAKDLNALCYSGVRRLSGINPALEGITDIGKKVKNRLIWVNGNRQIEITTQVTGAFVVFNMLADSLSQPLQQQFIGCFFDSIPEMRQGITIWRYKPWNSWTKPIRISHTDEMQDWDIQFFYWQYADGLYGAALPLSGNGYRTTLGNHLGKFAAKSVRAGGPPRKGEIPQMIIGFGADPYRLFDELFQKGMKSIGKEENLVINKKFPDRLDYIGWCTWNSSDMGRNLDENHILESVKSFKDSAFQLGWIIIDDGWFNNTGSRLNSYYPNIEKFPNGFKSMNQRLKSDYGLREIGLWHALNGYWNGINPDSEIGRQFKNELFSWRQREFVQQSDSPIITYFFIRPESDSLQNFYSNWHQWMTEQGFSFVKVDNQLVVERMAVNNYPLFSLSEKMHQAMNQSVFDHFDGAIINCMDMTADAYLNFGKTAIARSVEDYFTFEDGGVGYSMEKGGAAAHLIMAVYNALYFGEMVYPDFDMFQSHNPDAYFHAIARAANNGPVYITDKPGRQNFNVLRPLTYSDGKLIRADKPLRPTRDCLFQLQDPVLFKTFSESGNAGLLAAFNMADAEQVNGSISPADIEGLKGDKFLVYEYFSGESKILLSNESMPVRLNRMGYRFFYFIPIVEGIAPIGLVSKYNAPATILKQKREPGKLTLTVRENGIVKFYSEKKPASVSSNSRSIDFAYDSGVASVCINDAENNAMVIIDVFY